MRLAVRMALSCCQTKPSLLYASLTVSSLLSWSSDRTRPLFCNSALSSRRFSMAGTSCVPLRAPRSELSPARWLVLRMPPVLLSASPILKQSPVSVFWVWTFSSPKHSTQPVFVGIHWRLKAVCRRGWSCIDARVIRSEADARCCRSELKTLKVLAADAGLNGKVL